jgi:WD40 repeat protein
VNDRRVCYSVALLILAPALPALAADKDAFGDPLPEGAKARLGTAAMVFRASGGRITVLPPDYKTFLVPGIEGRSVQFELATGRPLDPRKSQFGFGGVVTSGDGKRVAIVPGTEKLTVRDAKTGNPIGEFSLPEGYRPQGGVALSKDGTVLARGAAGKDQKGAVAVSNTEKNEGQVIEALHGPPVLVSLSSDGALLVTYGYQFPAGPPKGVVDPNLGRTFQVWDVATGKERFRGTVTGAYQVATVAFSPDGGTLATSAGDGPVDVWDVKAGKRTRTLLGRAGMGARVAFSPDGKTVAALATDGAIRRWMVADGKLLGTTEPPDDLPLALPEGLAFADNDRVIAWGAANVTVAVAWEAPARKTLTPFSGQTTAVQSIAFTAGGKEIVAAGFGNQVFRWNATTGKRLGPVTLRANRMMYGYPQPTLRLSPDGSRGLAPFAPHGVYDLATGEQLFVLPGGSGGGPAVTTAAPAPDWTKAVTCSFPGDPKRPASVTVWDLTKQEKVTEVELDADGSSQSAVAVSPSGNRLLITSRPRVPGAQRAVLVTALDFKTGKQLSQVELASATGSAQLVAVDEKAAAVSVNDRVCVLDYERGEADREIDSFKGRTDGWPLPLACSPDGKLLAVGVPSEDRPVWGVRVYDWPSGKVRHTFTGHTGPVSALSFSPDGKTLASGSHDTTVLLWDLSTIPAPK